MSQSHPGVAAMPAGSAPSAKDRIADMQGWIYGTSYVERAYSYAQAARQEPRILQDVDRMRMFGTIPDELAPVKACIIQAAVNGIIMPAFVDTGATLSVISGSMATKLEEMGRLNRIQSDVRAAVFGNRGDTVQFRQAAMVDISVAGTHVQLKAQILDNLPFDCLLGDDFLSRSGANIDYANRVVAMGQLAVPFQRRGEVIRMVAGIYAHEVQWSAPSVGKQ
jgi:hypothetical protein